MPSPTTHRRRSFVYRRLIAAGASFINAADAAVALSVPGSAALKLIDLSALPRWGLRGRDVFSWLAARGTTPPRRDNQATRQADGTIIARLAPAEALVLAPMDGGSSAIGALIGRLPAAGEGACFPAPRRDSHAWFVVHGEDAARMFAKLCGVDLSPDRFAEGEVAQTSVARLSAIVIRNDIAGSLAYSVLADSASAEYLWDCLLDAMTEFSGGIAGADVLGFAGGPDERSDP